jgi:sugar phosphate permease
LLLFGLGQGLSEPIADTALNAITPDEFRGGVMSVRTSVLQAGTTVGPPLFITLATTVGYLDVLVGVGVAAFGLGTVAFVLIARYRRRTENQY